MDRTSRPLPRVLSRKPLVGKRDGGLKALLRANELNPIAEMAKQDSFERISRCQGWRSDIYKADCAGRKPQMMSELRELRADIYELNRSLDGSTISFALRKGDLARSRTSATASPRTDLQSPTTSVDFSSSPRTKSPSAHHRTNRNDYPYGHDERALRHTDRRSRSALARGQRGGRSIGVGGSDYELKIRFPPHHPPPPPPQGPLELPSRAAAAADASAADGAKRCRRGVQADYGGATDVGQLVRRVRASTKAVSRDKEGITRGLQAEREKTARLRVALEREGKAKHEWETLTEASRALKVRLESTERIRKRQKELIKELQAVEADIAFANAGGLSGRITPDYSLSLFSSPPPPPPPPPLPPAPPPPRAATRRGTSPSLSLMTSGRDAETLGREILVEDRLRGRRGERHTAERARVSSRVQQPQQQRLWRRSSRWVRPQSAESTSLGERAALQAKGGGSSNSSSGRSRSSSTVSNQSAAGRIFPSKAKVATEVFARTGGATNAAASRPEHGSSMVKRATVPKVGFAGRGEIKARGQRAGTRGGSGGGDDLSRTRRTRIASISSRMVVGAGVDLGLKPGAAATKTAGGHTARRLPSSSSVQAVPRPVSSSHSKGGRDTTRQKQRSAAAAAAAAAAATAAAAAAATATAAAAVTVAREPARRRKLTKVEVIRGVNFGAPTAASAGKVLPAKRAVASSRARAVAAKRGADARRGDKGRVGRTPFMPTRRNSSPATGLPLGAGTSSRAFHAHR